MKTDPLGTTDEVPSSTRGAAEQELRIVLVDNGDGAATLLLKGELDIAGFPLLESWLTRVESENQGSVIVDLEDLRFMDGSGLHAMSQAAARAENGGWTFRIVNAQGSVKRLFSLICPEMLGATEDVNGDLGVIDAVLQRIVALASQTIFRTNGASISLARGGRLATVAASNDTVLAMDADQYELGEGPCFSASNDGEKHYSPHLAAESRWPAFTPRAMSRGISSILSVPLAVRGAPIGALNLCSRSPRAFDGEKERATAYLLAGQASIFLRVHAGGAISPASLHAGAASRNPGEAFQAEDKVALAQSILEESLQERDRARIHTDEGPAFEPVWPDEKMLREMVTHIP